MHVEAQKKKVRGLANPTSGISDPTETEPKFKRAKPTSDEDEVFERELFAAMSKSP